MKKDSTDSESTHGWSLAEMQTANCCNRGSQTQIPVSHVSECDETLHPHPAVRLRQKDNNSQVAATDIQSSVGVQTSPSLLLRTGEIQPRRPSLIQEFKPHKHPDLCECEQSLLEPSKQYVHIDTQTELWRVSYLEYAQTGPSLTAVGPFSRFDYKLKKAQLFKDDTFVNCCQARLPSKAVNCSKNWFLCPSVEQQVSPLDIGVSELIQTEDYPEPTDENQRVICENCLGRTHRTVYKETPLVECECSVWDKIPGVSKITEEASAQVAQEDISPTKCIQTDRCFWIDVCQKSRLYPDGYRICGFRQPLPRTLWKSETDFSQQVTATDIGIMEETQTCQQLMLEKPFCSTCSRLPARRGMAPRVLTGRSGSFRVEHCDACITSSKVGAVLDVSTQVRLSDSSFSKEQQTCEEDSSLQTKFFLRGGQWASQSWH